MRCPSCGAQHEATSEARWRPFCSRRCKMIDLGNWLDEVYRISRPLGADDLGELEAMTEEGGERPALLRHVAERRELVS